MLEEPRSGSVTLLRPSPGKCADIAVRHRFRNHSSDVVASAERAGGSSSWRWSWSSWWWWWWDSSCQCGQTAVFDLPLWFATFVYHGCSPSSSLLCTVPGSSDELPARFTLNFEVGNVPRFWNSQVFKVQSLNSKLGLLVRASLATVRRRLGLFSPAMCWRWFVWYFHWFHSHVCTKHPISQIGYLYKDRTFGIILIMSLHTGRTEEHIVEKVIIRNGQNWRVTKWNENEI